MSALEVFKRAGLEGHVKQAFDFGQLGSQLGQGIQDYGKSGLIGAGVGAAGMGLASMLGGEDGESPEEKRNRVISNMLKGTALGGLAGVGGQAAYSHFMKPSPSGQTQQLEAAMAGKGKQLDTKAFGVNHPIAQQANNAARMHPLTEAPLAGAGLGMGYNFMRNRQAGKLFDKGLENIQGSGTDKGKLNTLTATDRFRAIGLNQSHPSKGVRQRFVEKVLAAGGGTIGDKAVNEVVGRQGLAAPAKVPELAAKMQNLAQSGVGGYQAGATADLPGGRFLPQKVQDFIRNGRSWTGNAVGKSMGPGALMSGARYAKYGLGGAAAGMGANAVGRGLMNTYLASKYEPEQLQYWNSFGDR